MRRLLVLAALLVAAPGLAAELPGLFDVTGVAADDVLNIRENPRATAAKVGELAPDATGVEVVDVSESGDWGRVNTAERSGWVNLSFLAERPGAAAGETSFARPLACFGTEPFWDLAFAPGAPTVMNRLGVEPQTFEMSLKIASANRGRAAQAALGFTETGVSMVGMLRRAQCSDGMSDRLYGFGFDLLLVDDAGAEMLSGCCSLAAGQ